MAGIALAHTHNLCFFWLNQVFFLAMYEVQQLIACSSLPTVSVECNYLNLRVVAKRALFHPDERVGLDELFLGTGCRVTYVRPDELEFNIPIQYCGIVIEVREGTVLPAAICSLFKCFFPLLSYYVCSAGVASLVP